MGSHINNEEDNEEDGGRQRQKERKGRRLRPRSPRARDLRNDGRGRYPTDRFVDRVREMLRKKFK